MKKLGLSLLLIATLMLSACGQAPTNDGTADAGNSNTPSKQEQNAAEKEAQEFLENISAETATYKGICGPDATWYWQDNVLVIKGTGEVTNASWFQENAQGDDLSDTSIVIMENTIWIVIEEGITNTCSKLVRGHPVPYYNLVKVILPSSLTTIGACSFYDCDDLTTIDIPDSVTTIENSAFYGCRGLTSVTIPNSVTSIGNSAFRHVPHIYYNGTAEDESGDNWGAEALN